jgi:long-chain fatty acid transport protein
MYFTDRGIRPMGRGYAFVAGADDAQSLWYNPAGLAWAGDSVFLDVGLTLMNADFTRVNSGGMTLPTVSLEAPPIPIPMLAFTNDFGLEDFGFGLGVFAPNLIPLKWPDQVTVDGRTEDAPQRYSLYNLDGSAAVHVAAGMAWRPIPELSIGADVQLVVGSLMTEVALSACDRVVCTFPESPEWDGRSQLNLPLFSVFGTIGATYASGPIRVGLSFQMPHNLGGTATLKVRLPEAALFDGATVEGDQADVSLWMPWILRAGVEVRPIHPLRVELAAVIEGWDVQKALEVKPKDIYMRDVVAIGDYRVGNIEVPRNMQTVLSLRLGGAYAVDRDERFTVRAGVNWETSGFSDEMLSPLTLDSGKVITGLGVGWEIVDGFFVDASYAHVFVFDRNVTTSQVPQPNPIRPPPVMGSPGTDAPVYVGNGTYAMDANQFGLGIRWNYDGGPRAREETGAERGEEDEAGDDPAPAETGNAPPTSGRGDPGAAGTVAADHGDEPSHGEGPRPDAQREGSPPTTSDPDSDSETDSDSDEVPWYYRNQTP